MSFKYRFLQRIIQITQGILYWRVKSSLSNQQIDELNLDPNKPVFYVTRYRSMTDALVLDHECKKAQLPRPFTPFSTEKNDEKGSKLQYWNQLIPLTRPGITEVSSKSPRYFSEKLQALIEKAYEDPEFDVQLVPASVFWGRSPKTEGSFWQAIFSDSWSIPGFFRKFLMVINKGRQTYVQLSSPFSLRQIIDRDSDQQKTLAKTHRVIRRRMKRQREAFIGPDLSHRRTLLLSIVDTPEIKEKIEKQAAAKKMPVDKVRKKALSYANEIAADYSHSVIKALSILFKWLWTKLYDGVKVYGSDELKKLAHDHAIVYVPSHRSHIDYLLLSYVLYEELELVPPHIAAGANLNIPVIGPILRRGGAFFMRRTFKDDPLYAAVFSEYLHRVIDRGFAIEYFIEGGRSRTGRQLPPKPGMLSMTLQSYNAANKRPLMFVPVNFCYERLFESKSYLGELRGKQKKKESLSQFFKSIKRIKENFGQVHVTFGEPISAKEFLQDEALLQGNTFSELGHPQQKQVALRLGDLISEKVNASATAHPIALLAVVLHATSKQALEEDLMESQLEILTRYLKEHPYSGVAHTTDLSPQEIIKQCEALDYICRYPNKFGDLVFATEKQAQLLSYFRNNILHFFALPSLIALVYKNNQDISEAELLQQAEELYPFIKAELFMQWNEFNIGEALRDTLETLKQEKLIFSNEKQRNSELLAGIIRPSLERYAIVLTLLEKAESGTLSPRELESQARTHAERMSRLYQVNSPEYFDSKVFNNLVQQLVSTSLVEQDEEGKLTFSDKLNEAARKTEVILGTNLHRTLWA